MLNIRQLIHRNAVLKTELRMVKEQLAQAHIANQFLLERLVVRDFQRRGRSESPRLEQETRRKRTLRLPVEAPIEHEDLLDLDDELVDTESSLSSPIYNVLVAGKPIDTAVDTSNAPRKDFDRGEREVGFGIYNGDSDDVFTPRSSPPGPFANRELDRLLGQACFIEDMTDHERAELWVRRVRDNPRHTVEQYEELYHSRIRPRYLENMEARGYVDRMQDSGLLVPEMSPIVPETPSPLDEDHRSGADEAIGVPNTASESLCAMLEELHEKPISAESPELHTLALQTPATSQISFQDLSSGLSTTRTSFSTSEEHDAASPDFSEPKVLTRYAADDRTAQTPQCMFGGSIAPSSDPPSLSENIPSVSYKTPNAPPISPRTSLSHSTHDTPEAREVSYSRHPYSIDSLFARPEQNSLRTVLINDIAPEITLSAVMSKIKAGPIISATYSETSKMKTTPPIRNTVFLVFLQSQHAQEFVKASGVPNVELVRTASRPVSPWLLRRIRQHGLTRVLFVHGGPSNWTLEEVVEYMVQCDVAVKRPLHACRDTDDESIMVFEFASMAEAMAAWSAVDRNYNVFQGVSKGFYQDPCELPLKRNLSAEADLDL